MKRFFRFSFLVIIALPFRCLRNDFILKKVLSICWFLLAYVIYKIIQINDAIMWSDFSFDCICVNKAVMLFSVAGVRFSRFRCAPEMKDPTFLRVLKSFRNPIQFLFSANLGSRLLFQALNTLSAIEQKRPGELFMWII